MKNLLTYIFFLLSIGFLITSLDRFLYSRSKVPTQSFTIKPTLEVETIDSEKLFRLINEWRVKNGFQTYIQDVRLCEIAKDRSDDEFDHQAFYDKYWNYPYMIQENLSTAYEPTTNKIILDGWLSSPPHRATLEKPYKYSCVACDKTCVQIFSNL